MGVVKVHNNFDTDANQSRVLQE